ncbi:MAG: hypothetical protein ACT4OJ_09045 [Bacteroidota bacterium]
MLRIFTIIFCTLTFSSASGQQGHTDSFYLYGDVKAAIDRPRFKKHKETLVIFYALPNGNTTAQTMGKKMQPGDDWHFDIQHIRAQTQFIRLQLRNKNVVVIYLENDYKSWPLWKQKHPDFKILIPKIIDSLAGMIAARGKSIYLNGHSGGGSFIFGYLSGVGPIPATVKRISFLDSNYGYDSSYYPAIRQWLKEIKGAALNVFAYNDSIALYNGKPPVSATGGTWYRGHLLLKHLQGDFLFSTAITDSLDIYRSADERVQFFFKTNPDRGIYHTQQVELNGFIHSVLCGTKHDSRKYRYYSSRAYSDLIE